MVVEIDQGSGFCFGVVRAIEAAERELEQGEALYCLGDIVHNTVEVDRLKRKGLKIVDHQEIQAMKGSKMMIRAHGEPPSTYKTLLEHDHTLVDATCPIVLNLQHKIRKAYEEIRERNGLIVILGKEGHAEVVGLKGQVSGHVMVIKSKKDLDGIDFGRPIRFFAQTTQDPKLFHLLKIAIEGRMKEIATNPEEVDFKAFDSICRQVSNRTPELIRFAQKHHVIVFVSDTKSSNGKLLYNTCKAANPRTYFVESPEDVDPKWFSFDESVGVCGATSTPRWIMEAVRTRILQC